MDAHALDVLEFPQLLHVLGGYSQTQAGRELILSTRPGTSRRHIVSKHGAYRDAMFLFEKGFRPPEIQFDDLHTILKRVAPKGASLAGEDLVLCRRLLRTVSTLREYLRRDDLQARKHLQRLGERLEPCDGLQRRLTDALDDDGTLLDSASPRLLELRQQVRSLERKIQRTLDSMVHSQDNRKAMQEKFITVRNGRFVVPVRRELKASLPGVVHDHSNSGQTVFIEPTETLGAGNELADARLEERDECLRILAELSGLVRDSRRELEQNQITLAAFDAALAVGRWACSYDCSFPHFADELQLKRARHPLLEAQFRNEGGARQVVPVDIVPGKDTDVLLITGSNTGGKTASLKAAGLLTLAAQSGLPVPVDSDSSFVVFENVFADIGDEQSLTASLSTFSAHMTHISRILREAPRARSLVLLDELGSGTDPLEGGALACAILHELFQAHALTIATTHLGVVKTYVHDQPGMVNAAVRFNSDTLAPEYVLEVGRPGASNALNIARGIGLPDAVIARAEKHLSSDHLRLEGILAQMEDDQRRISAREGELEKTMSGLARDRDELKTELGKLKRERRRLLHEAYQQASGIVENSRRQMEAMLQDLNTTSAPAAAKEVARRARKAITAKKQKLTDAVVQTAPKPETPLQTDKLEIGQTVWVEKLSADGTIIAFARGRSKVTVDVGGLRFDVPARQLGRAHDPSSGASSRSVVKVSRPRSSRHVPQELNLVGLRVDQAAPALERFMDQALLAGLPSVRIVHGFGTGRLQEAVHEWLGRSPTVLSFRLGKHGEDLGGAGATLVVLQRD